MKKTLSLVLSLVLLGALAETANAQVYRVETRGAPRAWFGFSHRGTRVEPMGKAPAQLVVADVVDDSPAQKAGLRSGDEIVRINGINATSELVILLGSSLNPGDTVTFRVRRAAREQDLRIIAGAPPRNYRRTVTPELMRDSANRFLQLFIDSTRVDVDPRMLERLPRGRYDTTIVRRLPSGDSVVERVYMWSDSMPGRMFHDSATVRFFRERTLHMDSTMRERIRVSPRDSVRFFGPGERVFEFERRGLPGEELVMRTLGFGHRAVAGAELQPLNPELARYFRTPTGVLLTNVPENTPARRAGLQAGDVITAVDGRAVTQVEEVRRAIDAAKAATVRIDYVRQGEKKSLQLRK